MPAAKEKFNLTDRFLAKLMPTPKGTRRMIWDAYTHNLAVSVTDKGTITFKVIGRRKGKKVGVQYHALGRYPELSLADARKQTAEVRRLYQQGTTPKLEEKKREAEEARQHGETFGVAAEASSNREKGR